MILDSDDDLDKARAGGRPKALPVKSIPGVLNWTRIPISELASARTESIDTSGPWYGVEEGRYVEETTPGLGSHEQHSVPSAPAQAQSQTLPQSSKPLQDQTNQQGVDDITRNTSVESALHFLPKSSDSGEDGLTDENMAELVKRTGVGFGRATSGVIIGWYTYLPESSLGRGTTGRDLEPRTQRNRR